MDTVPRPAPDEGDLMDLTPEAADTDLKLAEIIVVAAQGQEHNDQLIKEVHELADGLLKRNSNSWEGHKLSGDLALLDTQQAGVVAQRAGALPAAAARSR